MKAFSYPKGIDPMSLYSAAFEAGLSYEDFLATYATPEQLARWESTLASVQLSVAQQQVLQAMTRQINVLCFAGAWCGDCIEQCPIFERFSQTNPVLRIRYIDRDADAELREKLLICGAPRVPQLIYMNEELEFMGWGGDRTLSKYRRMASSQLGAACPSGLVIEDQLLAAVIQDWLNEFERIHWIARLSPRLRAKHGD